MNPVRDRALHRLREMVLGALGQHVGEVYLFGSCARGEERPRSDIDIGILPRDELPVSFFAELDEAIEESTIPYNVEIIDLRQVGRDFLEEVRRTGILWRA